jgi:hypothetical protein
MPNPLPFPPLQYTGNVYYGNPPATANKYPTNAYPTATNQYNPSYLPILGAPYGLPSVSNPNTALNGIDNNGAFSQAFNHYNDPMKNKPIDIAALPPPTSIANYQYQPATARHIPQQKMHNQGYTQGFIDETLYGHNPPYSPYGTQTKQEAGQQIISNLPNGLPFLMGGGDMYSTNPPAPVQDQNTVAAITNNLMGAQQLPISANPSMTVDANGNPIPATVNPNDPNSQLAGTNLPQPNNVVGQQMFDRNPITRNSNLSANAAFGFGLATDAAALMNNLVQAPPPTIQTPLTHLNRVDYDTTPFDTMKQAAAENANASMRQMREQSSQAADLIRGVGAINTNLNEADRQLGAAQTELMNKQTEQNNAIANQEQQIQNQENSQEQMTNYNIQQQAQQAKSAAVTSNLTELKKDMINEAQYNVTRQGQLQQEAIDTQDKQVQANLDMLGIKYQIDSQYTNQPEYMKGLSEYKSKALNDAHTATITEMQGTTLQGKSMNDIATRIASMPEIKAGADQQIQAYESTAITLQTQIDEMTQSFDQIPPDGDLSQKTTLSNQIAAAKQQLLQAEQYKTQGEAALKEYKELSAYQKAMRTKYDDSSATTTYSNQYRQQKGILNGDEYVTEAKKIIGQPSK